MTIPPKLPSASELSHIEEPYIRSRIFTPQEYVGNIIKLAQERRGIQTNMEYPSPNRVMLEYEFPLNEIVLDFYDRLKSVSRGYASFDYELIDYRLGDLSKLDILLNGDVVDALSLIVPKNRPTIEEENFVNSSKITAKASVRNYYPSSNRFQNHCQRNP